MNSTRKISVIIPVYNCEQYIERCLDSVIEQNFDDYEIICINDGSEDKSLQILEKYQENYDFIRIISIRNSGQGHARNLGIANSCGDYLLFIDADDSLKYNCLKLMYQNAIDNSSDICVGEIERIYTYKPSLLERIFFHNKNEKENFSSFLFENKNLINEILPSPVAKLIKKSYVNQNNIKFAENFIYEDLYFSQNLFVYNPKIVLCNKLVYSYFIRKNSTMQNNYKINDMFKIIDKIVDLYKNEGIYDEFKSELEYLIFYHLSIGTAYRLFKYGGRSIRSAIKETRNFIRKRNYNINIKNKYLKNANLMIKLYYFAFNII